MTENRAELTQLTAEIVAAFISHNSVQREDLQDLITSTFAALKATGQPAEIVADKPVPAISVKKSITSDYLISLEDGNRYKTLKRHLASRGLTPQQYREKWDLPFDYPMVAAAYAAKRSELAKSLGLGQIRQRKDAEPAAAKPAKTRKSKAPSSVAKKSA